MTNNALHSLFTWLCASIGIWEQVFGLSLTNNRQIWTSCVQKDLDYSFISLIICSFGLFFRAAYTQQRECGPYHRPSPPPQYDINWSPSLSTLVTEDNQSLRGDVLSWMLHSRDTLLSYSQTAWLVSDVEGCKRMRNGLYHNFSPVCI